MEVLGCIKTVKSLAGEEVEVAAPPQIATRAAPLERLAGAIEFAGVHYAYAPEAAALEDIYFRIEPGEHVALTGPSGGGKTTLVDLLLRFHDPASGVIRLDGRDLRSIAPADLRRQVAVVLQEPLLLQGTVADNLAYACVDP